MRRFLRAISGNRYGCLFFCIIFNGGKRNERKDKHCAECDSSENPEETVQAEVVRRFGMPLQLLPRTHRKNADGISLGDGAIQGEKTDKRNKDAVCGRPQTGK